MELNVESENDKELSLTAKISSILFIATKPVTIDSLVDATSKDYSEVEKAIEELLALYKDSIHGFSLAEVNGGYQFRTARAASKVICKFKPPKEKRISKAASETLAIIAYKQPVEKTEIETIRGVDALPTLKTLLEAKLIRVVGRENSIGHPALYGTTPKFLEVFGLKDLSDLPTIKELEQLIP